MSCLVFLLLAFGLRRWTDLPLMAEQKIEVRLNLRKNCICKKLLTANVAGLLEGLEDSGVHGDGEVLFVGQFLVALFRPFLSPVAKVISD